MRSDEIPGIDTIVNLVGSPPQEIPLSHSLLRGEDALRPEWNGHYIAVIPYCFSCKVPLVWHSPPSDNVLFHCPSCNRKWIKDKEWKENESKISAQK